MEVEDALKLFAANPTSQNFLKLREKCPRLATHPAIIAWALAWIRAMREEKEEN